MSKTVTVFLHTDMALPQRLGEIFETYGFEVSLMKSFKGGIGDFDPLRPDLLLVMGGDVSVHEAERCPHLFDEIKVIRARIDAEVPVLGICLGAQLIAKALGADTYRGNEGYEVGWHNLSLTSHGANSPVRHFCESKTPLMQWHQDTFDLPDGAVLLARGSNYKNQIFSYSDHVMAIQGHPETDRTIQLEEWIKRPEGQNKDEEIFEDFEANMNAMDKQFKKFMAAWLNDVGLLS